ncbi:hypothetical protein [Marimonas lutisalis]|uniref:hypothetical protein n=1 Tax=Marimonas lutisalis TaxID=2545756 RepID=UPI0010F6213C|nr:hypothetical protein [Marimonas lutisalis]
MADYLEHLASKLHEIDSGIEAAKAKLEKADIGEKTKALAELSQLRLLHEDLSNRIEDAKKKDADEWSSLRTGFQEEADGLKDTVEKWLTRLS